MTLKEVYEAIEGPLDIESCPFGLPVCDRTRCVLGDFFCRLNREAASKLQRTKVSDIARAIGGKYGQSQKDNRN